MNNQSLNSSLSLSLPFPLVFSFNSFHGILCFLSACPRRFVRGPFSIYFPVRLLSSTRRKEAERQRPRLYFFLYPDVAVDEYPVTPGMTLSGHRSFVDPPLHLLTPQRISQEPCQEQERTGFFCFAFVTVYSPSLRELCTTEVLRTHSRLYVPYSWRYVMLANRQEPDCSPRLCLTNTFCDINALPHLISK